MGRAELVGEIRKMRFLEVYERCRMRRLSHAEAAETLGVSERTFRRLRGRFAAEGEDGLLDRRIGKPSPRRIGDEAASRVAALYRERYGGWTVKHFHERAQERHGLLASYGWTKSVLHAAGLVRPAVKRSAHRKKRPRRPLPGMLLHQDGSRHLWLPALGRPIDLIVTMDDATSDLYSTFLVEEEGTASSFRGLGEAIARHGLFCALYTDRGSHYFRTPKAGGKVAHDQPTQVGRALAQLGIRHIAAYSPEARGRSERMFGTLQDRLVKELADAGIGSIAAAHRFIAETYLPPSCPGPARRWPRSSAIRRTAWSATTTPSCSASCACRSHPARCARTSSGPPSRCDAMATAPSPYSTGRAVSAVSTRRAPPSTPPPRPRDTLPRRPLWAGACPGPKPERSGQLTCYENRPT
jgi:transposase